METNELIARMEAIREKAHQLDNETMKLLQELLKEKYTMENKQTRGLIE
jgi:hypothetical protein